MADLDVSPPADWSRVNWRRLILLSSVMLLFFWFRWPKHVPRKQSSMNIVLDAQFLAMECRKWVSWLISILLPEGKNAIRLYCICIQLMTLTWQLDYNITNLLNIYNKKIYKLIHTQTHTPHISSSIML